VIGKLKDKEKRLTLYRDTSLMLAMFFLPFGYDALFKLLMEVTGSYWTADIIFYSISGCFWLSYIFFSKRISKKEKNTKELLND
jgi:threonine/homoserine efflux transporter RhtA